MRLHWMVKLLLLLAVHIIEVASGENYLELEVLLDLKQKTAQFTVGSGVRWLRGGWQRQACKPPT